MLMHNVFVFCHRCEGNIPITCTTKLLLFTYESQLHNDFCRSQLLEAKAHESCSENNILPDIDGNFSNLI